MGIFPSNFVFSPDVAVAVRVSRLEVGAKHAFQDGHVFFVLAFFLREVLLSLLLLLLSLCYARVESHVVVLCRPLSLSLARAACVAFLFVRVGVGCVYVPTPTPVVLLVLGNRSSRRRRRSSFARPRRLSRGSLPRR